MPNEGNAAVVKSVHLKSRGSTNADEKFASPYFAGTQRAHKASHGSKLITCAGGGLRQLSVLLKGKGYE